MIIYIGVFLSSLLCLYLGEKMRKNISWGRYEFLIGHKQFSLPRFSEIFLIGSAYIVAILLPSLLAGWRDYSIGTDVLVYGNPWFRNATLATDFGNFIQWAENSSIGGLYAAFNYVVSRFSSNPHTFYFWYSFVETTLAIWALRRSKINLVFGMTTYYFLFYNLTFNILRQGMAMLLIVWGFKYIKEKKFWRYLIVIIIASGFHNTAWIALFLYVLYWLVNSTRRRWFNNTILFACGLAILFFNRLAPILLTHGLVGDRYTDYLSDSNVRGGFLTHLLLCVPVLVLYLLGNTRKLSEDKLYNGLKIIVIFATLMSIFNLKFVYLGRVTQYFDFMLIFAVPYIGEKLHLQYDDNSDNTTGTKVLLVVYLVAYWYLTYVYMHSGATVPYLFGTS